MHWSHQQNACQPIPYKTELWKSGIPCRLQAAIMRIFVAAFVGLMFAPPAYSLSFPFPKGRPPVSVRLCCPGLILSGSVCCCGYHMVMKSPSQWSWDRWSKTCEVRPFWTLINTICLQSWETAWLDTTAPVWNFCPKVAREVADQKLMATQMFWQQGWVALDYGDVLVKNQRIHAVLLWVAFEPRWPEELLITKCWRQNFWTRTKKIAIRFTCTMYEQRRIKFDAW